MENNTYIYLGKIPINSLSTDPLLDYLVNNYYDYQEHISKLLSKFFSKNWGSVSTKDKIANNIGVDNSNLAGIYALYKSRRFGNIIISIDPEDDDLFIGYFPYKVRGKAYFHRSLKTV